MARLCASFADARASVQSQGDALAVIAALGRLLALGRAGQAEESWALANLAGTSERLRARLGPSPRAPPVIGVSRQPLIKNHKADGGG